MSKAIREQVDTNSPEFKAGVEAGINSAEDSKSWAAGNELGQELKDEGEKRVPMSDCPSNESATSLFVENIPKGYKGNLQDEKDETEE